MPSIKLKAFNTPIPKITEAIIKGSLSVVMYSKGRSMANRMSAKSWKISLIKCLTNTMSSIKLIKDIITKPIIKYELNVKGYTMLYKNNPNKTKMP
jgi:hypothetical protein